jgi:Fic family protein
MRFNDILVLIEQNQQKISAYGKFDDAILKKINYKLRLDWNYYSNRMEGGTLTKAETRSVMVGNIDVKGKPLKDVFEMTGHDKIVLEVLKMSKGELRIAEKRIKDIHKTIMYEEADEKALQIGKWKSHANEIINYKGEKIAFTSPADVAEEVHRIINAVNAELDKFYSDKKSKHPIEIAAQFHIDFVSVHPFYDGNGRTTRILTNIILMACDYPAIIVKDEHKQAYYKLLGDIQAYGGKTDLFYSFIAERVLETQQLIIDALEGKEIDDLDDFDKEIQIFKKQLEAKQLLGSVKKSNEVIHHIYFNCIKKLFDTIEQKHNSFDNLFSENEYLRNINREYPIKNNETFLDDAISQLINNESNEFSEYINKDINSLGFFIYHKNFQKDGLNMFDANYSISVELDDYQFHISSDGVGKFSYAYDSLPNEEDISRIVKTIMKAHLDELKKNMSK